MYKFITIGDGLDGDINKQGPFQLIDSDLSVVLVNSNTYEVSLSLMRR